MKRTISLLMVMIIIVSMLIIPVNAAEAKVEQLYIKPGWGYYRLWLDNRNKLPSNWTYKDLEAACKNQPLIANTFIDVPIGKTTVNNNNGNNNKTDKNIGYKEKKVWISAGDGYDIVAKRLGVSSKELQRLNNSKMLFADQYMTLKVPSGKSLQKGAVVGEATLTYKTAPESTMTNVKVAAKLLNGMIIKSGSNFDYLRDMAPCRKSLGYVLAPAISSTGTSRGGGICFVSTTLHTASLNANMQVTERHPHSRKSTYANRNQEAAIWRTGTQKKNLVFKNTCGYDVKIVTSVSGKSLTIKLVVC